MHCKIMLVDDTVLCTGSENLFMNDINNNSEVFFNFRFHNKDSKAILLIKDQFDRIRLDDRTSYYTTFSENAVKQKDSDDILIKYVAFSPEQNSVAAVVSAIDEATNEIIVIEAFFRDETIRRALLRAKNRGVNVKILLDKASFAFARLLVADGFNVKVYNKQNAIMHYKTILIDGKLVFTGSLNLSKRSLKADREFFILMESKNLYSILQKRFEHIWYDDNCILPDAASFFQKVKYTLKLILL